MVNSDERNKNDCHVLLQLYGVKFNGEIDILQFDCVVYSFSENFFCRCFVQLQKISMTASIKKKDYLICDLPNKSRLHILQKYMDITLLL